MNTRDFLHIPLKEKSPVSLIYISTHVKKNIKLLKWLKGYENVTSMKLCGTKEICCSKEKNTVTSLTPMCCLPLKMMVKYKNACLLTIQKSS